MASRFRKITKKIDKNQDNVNLDLSKLGLSSENEIVFKEYIKAPYGMIFEFPAIILEEILGLGDRQKVYLLRHKLIFTIHFIGIIGFFFFSRDSRRTNYCMDANGI